MSSVYILSFERNLFRLPHLHYKKSVRPALLHDAWVVRYSTLQDSENFLGTCQVQTSRLQTLRNSPKQP